MVAMNTSDTPQEAHFRVRYGKEGALQLTLMSIFFTTMLIIFSVVCIALYNKIPAPRYFAINDKKEFFELPPLSEPSLSQSMLQNWVVQFALASHTFDFYYYDNQMREMQRFFTDSGYAQYRAAMQPFLSNIKSLQVMLTCTVMEAPSIKRTTVLEGVYQWYVEIPINVRYDSASMSKSENRTLRMVIKRTNVIDNPYGIAVSNFKA
jgi:hypothetical protein